MTVLKAAALSGALVLLYPACGSAQAEGPRYDSCLALDQNGRPLPNPNASFICNQIEFQRQDCEGLRRRTPADIVVMNVTHCVDFRVEDVRARPGGASSSTREDQKTGGNSSGN